MSFVINSNPHIFRLFMNSLTLSNLDSISAIFRWPLQKERGMYNSNARKIQMNSKNTNRQRRLPNFQHSIGFEKKILKICAHQGKAIHRYVYWIVGQWRVCHVARNHFAIRCHQVEVVALLWNRFRQAGFTASEIRDHVVYWPEIGFKNLICCFLDRTL